MASPKYITRLNKVPHIQGEDLRRLEEVERKFAFRSNEYYLSLIDWDDPEDPIRRIVIPDQYELEEWGRLDPSGEKGYTVAPGMEHKYEQTALLLVSDQCGGYCRYCFRKRLFMGQNRELVRDLTRDLEYISSHKEITNVLLTGGDPMFLSTKILNKIVQRLREIEHVQIIRIGTKMPAYNPYRIINDPTLPDMIRKFSTEEKRIYIITQFNHPRELSDVAVRALDILVGAGAILANQTPLLRGINDNPDVLAELFRKLSFIGNPPYYLFQCRPTIGNRRFTVPVEESYLIFEKAKSQCSGLAKRANYVMSHKCGKIAVTGLDDDHIYFRMHQSADWEDIGKFMVYERNPEALWFDDYTEPVSEKRFDQLK